MDERIRTIPQERFKSDTSHLVPLSKDAIALLDTLQSLPSPLALRAVHEEALARRVYVRGSRQVDNQPASIGDGVLCAHPGRGGRPGGSPRADVRSASLRGASIRVKGSENAVFRYQRTNRASTTTRHRHEIARSSSGHDKRLRAPRPSFFGGATQASDFQGCLGPDSMPARASQTLSRSSSTKTPCNGLGVSIGLALQEKVSRIDR